MPYELDWARNCHMRCLVENSAHYFQQRAAQMSIMGKQMSARDRQIIIKFSWKAWQIQILRNPPRIAQLRTCVAKRKGELLLPLICQNRIFKNFDFISIIIKIKAACFEVNCVTRQNRFCIVACNFHTDSPHIHPWRQLPQGHLQKE